MKRAIYLCYLLLSLPLLITAQQDIIVTESEQMMSMGNNNAFIVSIPENTVKDLNSDWKKYLKRDVDGKLEDKKGEYKMLNVINKNLSGVPISIFAKMTQSTDAVVLALWVSEGETFINSKNNESKAKAVSTFLRDFAIQAYKDAVQNTIDKERKKLKEAEKMLNGFVTDQRKAETNLASNTKEIERLQLKNKEEISNIEKAKNNQVDAQKAVLTQKQVVDQVTVKKDKIK